MEALLRLRTATLKQLLAATDVSRSNMYPILDSLSAKGLCRRLPGHYAVWECPEPQVVVAKLRAAEEARLHTALEKAERGFDEVGAMLATFPSGAEDWPVALVDDVRLGMLYEEALPSVDSEVLVLNLGPYPGESEPNPPVLDALARGVRARAIWQSDELAAPDGEVRRLADAYAAAGVEQRVVERVPAPVAVIGHDLALLVLPSTGRFATEQMPGIAVRNERIVELVAAAFEHLWDQALPYQVSEEALAAAATGSPIPAAANTVTQPIAKDVL